MKSNLSAFTPYSALDRWTPVVNPGVANTKDWVQIGNGYHPRGISHVQDTNNLHGIGYPSWGDSTADGIDQVYTEVFDVCTDCAAGKISAAIGASTANTCASCAAGTYQDAVVVVTNPPEASLTYSSISGAGGVHHDKSNQSIDKSTLDGTFCWAAGSNTLPQYMQIDLGSSFRVHGVVTQCRFDGDQCVLEMEVQSSLKTRSLEYLKSLISIINHLLFSSSIH